MIHDSWFMIILMLKIIWCMLYDYDSVCLYDDWYDKLYDDNDIPNK